MSGYINFKQLDAAGIYLIRLLSSVLHEKDIPSLPSNLTWEYIFYMAKKHSVEAMAFYGAEKFIKDNEVLYKTWKRCRDANLAQDLIQTEACREIFHSLYKADIRFLPLKGLKLKCLYKKPAFRQMSDIDILIDPENLSQIEILMTKLGYRFQENFRPYHDEYTKAPCITVEFHKQMLSSHNPKQNYYADIWKKVIPDTETRGGWKMTSEDFYIFQIVHLWKHYIVSGSGIRSIMDIYVYLNKFREEMNWSYIRQELQKLDLSNFSMQMEALSQYWFSESDKTQNTVIKNISKLQRRMFFSGAYGSDMSRRFNKMDVSQVEKGILHKIVYLFRRLFDKQALEYLYPTVNKYPALLPFFWFCRLWNAILHNKAAIKNELKLLQNMSKKD